MIVKFMNRRQAESLSPSNNIFLISVVDPGRQARLKEGWQNLLKLEFDDLCPQELESIGRTDLIRTAKFFSQEDGKKIVRSMANLPKNVDKIYVHCEKGRSRSVAIALFLSEKFNSPIDVLHVNPNPHILRTLKSL